MKKGDVMKKHVYLLSWICWLLIPAMQGCTPVRKSSPSVPVQPSATQLPSDDTVPPTNEGDAAPEDILPLPNKIDAARDIDSDVIDLRRLIGSDSANQQKAGAPQYALGMMYYKGEGVPQDYTVAGQWFRKAAKQGSRDAQCRLGLMYYSGQGVAKSDPEAVKWLTRAAEQGHTKAQYNLGVLYDTGDGVQQNRPEAIKWYQKAAEQGSVRAQFNLARLYLLEEENKENTELGMAWLRKAAHGHHGQAQTQLARCYYAGVSVLQDYIEAYKWASLAAENGEGTTIKDTLEKALSQAQIDEAMRRVREFGGKNEHDGK